MTPRKSDRRGQPARRAPPARTPPPTSTSAPRLLAGGNPQIPKGDGDAPVQAWIAAVPGDRRELARRLDAAIVRAMPGVRKGVRWNSPLYGVEGRGWFLGLHVFTRYVKVTFFQGASLRPVPPGGAGPASRWLDVHAHDTIDEARLARWVRQAAALPLFDG